MAFNSVLFAGFFFIVLAAVYVVRGRRQVLLLTVFSYLFYAASGPAFVLLLFTSTIVDFHVGRALGRSSVPARRRLLLIISLVVNLGLLGVFKYAGFVCTQLNALFAMVSLNVSLPYTNVPLPVGISFYTFQTLSYTIDIYRREMEPTDNLTDFFCFVAFFPQLVAGPIVRARDFLPQLKTYRPLQPENVKLGFEFMLKGLFKKMVIADNLAYLVEKGFSAPVHEMCPANLLLAGALFAVQIYCDFSGYTDVARGAAKILGFDIAANFRWPYFSATVREFWRRWHITLSTWLRDYVYFSLGGGRRGRVRRAANVFVTWFLCGLWHGASWNFVCWGLYNGFFVELSRAIPERLIPRLKVLLVPATFLITCFGWMLFRAQSMRQAAYMMAKAAGGMNLLRAVPGLPEANAQHLGLSGYFNAFPYCGWTGVFILVVLGVIHVVSNRFDYSLEGRAMFTHLRDAGYVLLAAAIILAIMLFMGPQESFIYFAF